MVFIVKQPQETQLNASMFLNETRPLAVGLDDSIKSENSKQRSVPLKQQQPLNLQPGLRACLLCSSLTLPLMNNKSRS